MVGAQGRTYLDVMDDMTSSFKEKGWEIRNDSHKIDDELLVYKCTLHCKWRYLCDCDATIEIQNVPPLHKFQVMWYNKAKSHSVQEDSNVFETYF